MASETTRELALLVKRADEIEAHHPLMTYYCKCLTLTSESDATQIWRCHLEICLSPDTTKRLKRIYPRTQRSTTHPTAHS